MSLYNYVDPINANLTCCICRAPFTEPTTTLTCAHTFCADCILRALSNAPSCPVDRTPLAPTDLGPVNPIVRSLVDELRVECVYKADGCGYVSQRQVMPLHLRDECDYAEVRCEEKEDGKTCGSSMRRMELRAHQKKVHGLWEQEQEEESLLFEETDSEEAKENHTCPHASIGCPYSGPLEPSEHLPGCPYESLKGFFTTNNAKMSLLTEQNMVLRHKVDTLEHTVHMLRKEMNAAKNALGPWFRSSYQTMSLPAHGGVARSIAGAVGVASSDLPIRMQPAVAGPSTAGFEDSVDVLAPYFPAQDEMRRGRWTPSSMADSVYGRAGGVVAPLDLGTTLEGTLEGLRESVVGLALGVDSVGRRGEIALTNETLRLGEELMSVRAQMHGLRMQVHGMMMDRNASLTMREEAGAGMGPGGAYLRAHTNFGSITKL
ncbi:hypothetical protein BDN70DRAFT_875489 [Pholiota conissans]|uniref:RING-type domain-containing protein n=1 Tax=Pholiota conissans TaxID=109636 RepID=A0A9P5Z7D1_9AGAR|nr:hypothetical protein BDN70DRAFT_875489 [Pholiota conissans]